ncbi:hypothetical protein ABIE67_009023 [Streptomyces sp. V4I8]|uniref:hypothetical protein n=1 Tax=Streptomyces sp. V4I8 TaxID=3156469 RepID=UPI003515B69A
MMGSHPLGPAAGGHHGDGQRDLGGPRVGGRGIRWWGGGAQAVAMCRDAFLDGLVEALENMEPVRDLQRSRGAERGTLGIRP